MKKLNKIDEEILKYSTNEKKLQEQLKVIRLKKQVTTDKKTINDLKNELETVQKELNQIAWVKPILNENHVQDEINLKNDLARASNYRRLVQRVEDAYNLNENDAINKLVNIVNSYLKM